jgi:hypothetical protein
MAVVSIAAGTNEFAIVISHYSADICIKLVFDLRHDKPKPVLSREDYMEIAAE